MNIIAMITLILSISSCWQSSNG